MLEKSAFISAMLRTMAYKDPVATTAQKYKPIQSVIPETTLGPIQIEAFLGGGVVSSRECPVISKYRASVHT
ncbi:NO-associated protein 1 chloroplastic/mitochondrial [Zea mays]|uniref:NO-associated protein 1 chloroplastic/mitochondrial n=1 Tax=Zea mays TaxID=4577 RepID=A0A1D6H2M8_MAIZE|nr:NO-associated protein 1 chloroplastic/mitochondrial [Zea mays]